MCVRQILSVSWNTRLRNINLRHVYGIIRYPQELGCTFYVNILPNNEKHSTKSHGGDVYLTCFSKSFHPNTFRDIIIKDFKWTITKWRTQSHSCSWAIQHKSPLNIQYNNFETHKNKVHNISLQIISTDQAPRPSPKSRHSADDIFICIEIVFIENCGF